jgi:outer membrane protein OmpA-like peptidoglycan-associated protein
MKDMRWIPALLLVTGAVAGCGGGATLFEGKDRLAIVGTPPRPPPAPKPPEPVPEAPKRVVVTPKAIVISDKIQFELARATIKSASFGLLDEVVDVLKKNARIKKIAVEGYASADGSAAGNLKLSDDRAKSVAKYLTDHGIDAGRVMAKGYGVERPIADNGTVEGREKNRRVEFNIVEQDTAPVAE